MSTETTDRTDFHGWVLYDGDCVLCRRLARRARGWLWRRGFRMRPLQEPWVIKALGMSREERMRDMKILTPGGRVYRGVDGLFYLVGQAWWGVWIRRLGQWRPINALSWRLYRVFARNRYCISDVCTRGARTVSGSRMKEIDT